MEIVIKIPDRIQYGIENGITVNGSEASQIVLDAVKNGIPLPKGHGALKDVDEVMNVMERNCDMQDLYLPIHFKQFALDEAKTIVPADKEVEECKNRLSRMRYKVTPWDCPEKARLFDTFIDALQWGNINFGSRYDLHEVDE